MPRPWLALAVAAALVTPPATAAPTASRGKLAAARNLHTATTLADGRVVVIGGLQDPPLLTLGSIEIYDPATRRWRGGLSMAHSRKGHTATLLPDGRVLVIGGGRFHRRLARWSDPPPEIWDPASGRWSIAAAIRDLPREGHTATLLANGRVLVAGGMSSEGVGGDAPQPVVYDPARDRWSRAGRLVTPRLLHAAALLDDGRVVLVAGMSNEVTVTVEDGVTVSRPVMDILDTIETWDPATGGWEVAATLATKRTSHTATVLADGRVLVVGGSDTRSFLASAEVCDLQAGACTNAGTLAIPRAGHAAVRLRSGEVAVIGGETGSIGKPSQVAAIEIWNPTTGAWRTGAKLGRARHEHTASLLPDGTVLVAGGAGCGKGCERSTGSIEVVKP